MTYPQVERAIELATRWHRGQERDGENPLPYITHPLEVLGFLRHIGKVTDEELLCVAVLHDLFEETEIEEGEIEKIFGGRVFGLVKKLTRREPSENETAGLSKSEIWQLRSEMLLEEIGKMSADAQTVKLADRLSNVREAFNTKSGEKLDRYVKQTRTILKIVPRKVNVGLWDAIENAVRVA